MFWLSLAPFRNLVTSLIQHEQIKTTLPKARDTARLAEKVYIYFVSVIVTFLNKNF